MRDISKKRLIATNLLVAFEDGTVSVRIPRGTTLADISDNLEKIGKWRQGPPLSIAVRFKAPGVNAHGAAPAHPPVSPSP